MTFTHPRHQDSPCTSLGSGKAKLTFACVRDLFWGNLHSWNIGLICLSKSYSNCCTAENPHLAGSKIPRNNIKDLIAPSRLQICSALYPYFHTRAKNCQGHILVHTLPYQSHKVLSADEIQPSCFSHWVWIVRWPKGLFLLGSHALKGTYHVQL